MERAFRAKNLKLISIVTAYSIFLTIFFGISQSVSAQGNDVLLNAGFETVEGTKPTEWTLSPQEKCEISQQQVYKGNYSLRINDDSSSASVQARSNPITAKAGKIYAASVYSYNESGVSQIYLEFYNNEDERIGVTIAANEDLNEWKKIKTQSIAPIGTTYARVLLYSQGSHIGVCYFDNVSFTIIDELINGNFETVEGTKPAEWTLSPQEKCEISEQQVYRGNYSLKINDDSSTASVLARSNPIAAEAGRIYEASVYSYNESGVSQIYLEFYNIEDERIGVTIAANEDLNEWKKMKTQCIAPIGTTYARVLLYSQGSNTGVCYLDNASFTIIDELINGDFETVDGTNPAEWTLSPQEKCEISEQQVYSGNYSLKINDDSSSASVLARSNHIAAEARGIYEASVYSYNGSGISQIYLEFYNNEDERIGVVTAANEELNEWKKIKARGIAPDGTAYSRVLLYSSGTSVDICYFDNASFTSIDELINGDFETVEGTNPAEWTLSPQEKCEISEQQVYSGNYSLKINDDSSSASVLARSNPITAEAGKIYTASVYSYNESGVSQIYLEFYNNEDERIGVVTAANGDLNEWKKIKTQSIAPIGTTYARVLLYSQGSHISVCYFDNADFKKLNDELVNGSFEEVTGGKPDSWWSDTPENFDASTENSNSGNYSLKVIDNIGTSSVCIRSDRICLEEGSKYQAMGYSYNVNGSSSLSLEIYDNQDILIKSVSNQNDTIGEWQAILVDAIAPDQSSYAVICLSTDGEGTGITYFDDAEFLFVTNDPIREFPLVETGHPRLFFTENDIQGLKVKAEDTTETAMGISGQDLWEEIETTAESYLTETSFTVLYFGNYPVTYQLPPQMPGPMSPPPGFSAGAYPYWTGMASEIQNRLEILSIAYCITDEAAFAQRAKQYALAVASWDSWTDEYYLPSGYHSLLDTAHLTMGVCMVYDVLYDYLTENERSTLEDALVLKGLEPMYLDAKVKNDNNLDMLRNSALGTGGAVLLGENENAEKYMTRATAYYKWYLDMRMNSGQQEGIMYVSYAIENFIKSIDHIARTTGENELIEHPFINDFVVRWAIYTLCPGTGGNVNFSDSSLGGYFHNTMSVINSHFGNGYAGWYLENTKPSASPLERFLYLNPDMTITSPETLDLSAAFDEIGWAALRSGWSDDDTMLAFVSNDSRLGHNHYDQNSFIIATNNTQIATDPGYQDFSGGAPTNFSLKYGHNSILVNGMPQAYKGGGVMTEGILSSDYDYVKGSAANAYSPALERFDRHIAFVKPYYYVIYDDLKADVSKYYDWILYTGDAQTFKVDGIPVSIGQNVTGEHIYVQKSFSQMAVKFLTPQALPITVSRYTGAEKYGQYIKIGSASQKQEHKFLAIVKAGPYFLPDAIKKVADMGRHYDSSGCEYKYVAVNDSKAYLYKAENVGDYVTFTFDVNETGEYGINALFNKSPLYGQWRVFIDGQQIGNAFDGYNSEVIQAPLYELGSMYLQEGSHTITFETVGKNVNSGDYLTGVDSIILTESSGMPTEELSIDAQYMQGTYAIGATVVRNSEITDTIIFKDVNADNFIIGDITGNAVQAVISEDEDTIPERLAMIQGSNIIKDGQTLLSGTGLFSASFRRYDDEEQLKGVIKTDTIITVSIYTGTNSVVVLNGQQLPGQSVTYDEQTGLLSFSVPAGTNMVALGLEE